MFTSPYFTVLVYIGASLFLSLFLVALSYLVSKKMPYKGKVAPYECGFDMFVGERPFDVRFYLIGLLFIIFDLELVFLFPWSIALPSLSLGAFFSMMLFLLVLVIGFVYEWKEGALEWD